MRPNSCQITRLQPRAKSLAILTAILAAATLARAQNQPTTAPAPSATIPLQRVILYASGVGYFEHQGPVTGNATAALNFKQDQINDVLKSLMLRDAGGGQINAVTYPSQDPLAKTLGSFAIDLSKNPSQADLLAQLRGAAITVTAGANEVITGTILGVENRQKRVGPQQDAVQNIAVVNLVTDAGIRAIPLDDIQRFTLDDPHLNHELTQALAALAQSRSTDKKTVTIDCQGNGERSITIGYVVQTPQWKTSYRLLLPAADSKDKSQIQGWALVENQTDNDWHDISLGLVGGRPLSFVEDLYTPLYTQRPVVQPQSYASIGPQTYEESNREHGAQQSQLFDTQQALAAAPAPMINAPRDIEDNKSGGSGDLLKAGIAALASSEKIGAMFHFTIPHVSLARQSSAMIPIITGTIDATPISIFNASVLARHPLHGARLKNSTDKYLLGGPITVLVNTPHGSSYAGDATIDDVSPGQERLLSFAIDQDLLVDTNENDPPQSILTASIVNGVLNLQYRDELDQTYTIDNHGDGAEQLLIEHPRHDNYTLIDPKAAPEQTDQLYRFTLNVPAGGHQTFAVQEQWVHTETIATLPLNTDPLIQFTQNGKIPQKVRDALTTAIQKKQTIAVLNQRKDQLATDRQQLLDDEQNARENIKVLPAGSKEQQDQIALLSKKVADLTANRAANEDMQKQINEANADLADYVNHLNVP
jgi:hypothetical protein